MSSTISATPGPTRFDWKNFTDGVVAISGVLVRIAAVVAVVFIVFAPQDIPILRRFAVKSSKINVLGQEIELVDISLTSSAVEITKDGKLLIAGMDANDVPDQIAKLRQTGADLKTQNDNLKQSVDQLTALFDATKKQLDDANAKLQAGGAGPVPTADLNSQISAVTKFADQQLKTAALAQAAASDVLRQAEASASPAFGIVFGGDASPQAAMDEVKKVTKSNNFPVSLYKRQGSWRSVATFPSNAAARDALPEVKKVRGDAYLVDLSKWCPSPSSISAAVNGIAAQFDCGF